MNQPRRLLSLIVMFATFSCSAEESQTAEERREQSTHTEVWDPEPRIITPGMNGSPPSDAIVLFDGSDLDEWETKSGAPITWDISEGALVVTEGMGSIRTRQSFGNVQLHVEWRVPAEVAGSGQQRGNSGVFLMGRYEVQILDSYKNRTYANGQAGSIYKQHIPLVNASRQPGDWQSFDVIFSAPQFNAEGRVLSRATVTVLHNGVLIQNHMPVLGSTTWVGAPRYAPHSEKPLILQNHGSPVSFRNIWIRRL